jgi:hypothetical protein
MAWHRQSGGKQRRVRRRWRTRGGHGVGADEMQRWPPFIATHCVGAMRACVEGEGGDGSAHHGSRASALSCGVERSKAAMAGLAWM